MLSKTSLTSIFDPSDPQSAINRLQSSLASDLNPLLSTPTINGVHKTGMGSVAMGPTPSGEANNGPLTNDFITWFYSGDGAMGILSATYAIVPPVESLYDSPVWRNLPGPPSNTKVFSDSIKFGAINPNTIPAAVQSVINKELRDAEDGVVLNGADIMDSLKKAETNVNAAMAEAKAG